MKARVFSGILGAIVIIFFTWLGHLWLAAGMGIIILLGVWEYYGLTKSMGFQLSLPLVMGGSMLFLLAASVELPFWHFSGPTGVGPAGFIVAAMLFIMLLVELICEETQVALAKIGVGILGVVYPGLLLSYIILIRRLPEPFGFHLLIFTYIITWGCDTGAFFVGTLFGKHKLMPRISPNKSIEGAIGGVIIGSAAAIIYSSIVGIPWFPWAILAPVGTVIAQLGDLFESLLKRAAHVKDSGQFLPGHGGVLDRFDSLIFVAPFIYYFALFFIYT
ncbi:MAG TPA: phosphatidate cytidylyltransferase [Bacillota bacterium]|nr:phosphatidate cytidylyltransferase [Bacillota bacterium]